MSQNGTSQRGTMKAQQMDPADLKIKLREIPIPTPKANEILVKILCASLCHSDIMIFEKNDEMQYPEKPTTMGHEATGQVVEWGSGVKGFQVGDKIGFNPATNVCYECFPCKKVHNLWCEKSRPLMQGFGVDGYFAEYAVIDWHNAIRLPDSLDPIAAAPLFCAGVTAFHAIDDLKLQANSWVAIIGCGGLGLLAVQYARAMGYRVIGIDTAAFALKEAKSAGASHTFDPAVSSAKGEKSYVDKIMEITGGGVEAAVNFTASKHAYAGMPAIIRPGHGILMCVGIPAQPIELNVFDIALGKFKTEYFNLEDLPLMVERMQNHTARGRMAVKF